MLGRLFEPTVHSGVIFVSARAGGAAVDGEHDWRTADIGDWAGSPEQIHAIRQRKFRILVVDNHDSFRTSLGKLLKRIYGASVHAVEGGREAESAASAGQAFDFILLDVSMPGQNGLVTCRRLRELGIESSIVMMTAHEASEVAGEVRALGVPLLRKPINLVALTAILGTSPRADS